MTRKSSELQESTGRAREVQDQRRKIFQEPASARGREQRLRFEYGVANAPAKSALYRHYRQHLRQLLSEEDLTKKAVEQAKNYILHDGDCGVLDRRTHEILLTSLLGLAVG